VGRCTFWKPSAGSLQSHHIKKSLLYTYCMLQRHVNHNLSLAAAGPAAYRTARCDTQQTADGLSQQRLVRELPHLSTLRSALAHCVG
jgi:hypothetical protein